MIPPSIISKLNNKEEAINYGSVTLEVIKHDGHISRYVWIEKNSEAEDAAASGENGYGTKIRARTKGTSSRG